MYFGASLNECFHQSIPDGRQLIHTHDFYGAGYKDEVMTSIVNLLKPLNISLPPPFNDGYFGFFYKVSKPQCERATSKQRFQMYDV